MSAKKYKEQKSFRIKSHRQYSPTVTILYVVENGSALSYYVSELGRFNLVVFGLLVGCFGGTTSSVPAGGSSGGRVLGR